jgi:hypothetical protein
MFTLYLNFISTITYYIIFFYFTPFGTHAFVHVPFVKKPVWAPKAHVAHLAKTLTMHYI